MADTSPRCLLAHPDDRVASPIAAVLTADGWQVSRARTAVAAQAQLEHGRCDVLVVSAVHAQLLGSPVQTIALTAQTDSPGRLLDLGAAAVCNEQPLRLNELRVRARALLRRSGGVQLDVPRHRASLGGVELPLTPKEFALLQALMDAPGELLTRAALSRYMWGTQEPGTRDRALDAHAARLKQKLGNSSHMIQTVWGLGYRLEQPAPVAPPGMLTP